MNYKNFLEEFEGQSAADRDLAYQKIVVYGAKLASELEAITQLIDMMNKIRTPAANDPAPTQPEPEAA